MIALGKKLVTELGAEEDNDTLGRWMAHQLADLLTRYETAPVAEKEHLRQTCEDSILKIWAHRSQFPRGHRPFESFTPIFNTLQELDLSDPTPRYFRNAALRAREEKRDPARKWLDCATAIDDSARILIRYCLTRGAEKALDQEAEWVSLVHDLTKVSDDDLRIIVVLARQAELLNANDPESVERAELEKLSSKLDFFSEFASKVSADLKARVPRKRRARKPKP